MRTFTNIFLFNLSLMDLLRIIVCMPSAVILDVTKNWYFGTPLCKMIAFIEAFAVIVSELTLSYIAYDRWHTLQDPFKTSNSSSSNQRPKMIIILMWALAAVLALPEPFMSNVISSFGDNEPRNHSTVLYTMKCTRDWSMETDAFYVIIKVIFSFCCPLIFMLVVYLKVIRYIWKHKAMAPTYFFYGSTSRGRFNEPLSVRSLNRQCMHRFQRRKQTIRMLIVITVIYNLGYLPVYIITTIKFFVVYKDEKLKTTIKMMAHWFCYSTAAITPIIYGLMSDRFREEFRHMCQSPAAYCCICPTKMKRITKLKSNKDEDSEGRFNVDKPLISLNPKTHREPMVASKEQERHKDLVSTPSSISQATHKTLSPMTSDTSGSTNCTRSTNLSFDTERGHSLDGSKAIPSEGTVKAHANKEGSYAPEPEGDIRFDKEKVIAEPTSITAKRKEDADGSASEIVYALVHTKPIEDVESLSMATSTHEILSRNEKRRSLQMFQPFTDNDKTCTLKKCKSCTINSN